MGNQSNDFCTPPELIDSLTTTQRKLLNALKKHGVKGFSKTVKFTDNGVYDYLKWLRAYEKTSRKVSIRACWQGCEICKAGSTT
jgi:hypothetical protein